MSLAQNRPTIHQQFCLSEYVSKYFYFWTHPHLMKKIINCNLSQVVNDVTFWSLRVASRCVAFCANTPLIEFQDNNAVFSLSDNSDVFDKFPTQVSAKQM